MMKVEIPLREIFKLKTVARLSEYLEALTYQDTFNVHPIQKKEFYEVSSPQKRLFLLEQFTGIGKSYNQFLAVRITGSLDIKKVEEIFRKIVDRHESFRTSFHFIDERPVQIVHSNMDFKIHYEEINEITNKISIEKYIHKFDISKAPLLKVTLLKIDVEEFIMIVDMHHIIADGTSRRILLSEFIALYEGKTLPELKIQYKDFAAWQNSILETDIIKEQEEYWINKFKTEVKPLNMPLDYSRPQIQSYSGDIVNFGAGKELTLKIKEITKRYSGTLFMTLLSAYSVLLHKYTAQEDIVIGFPIYGRRSSELDNIIGMFVNTLAIRTAPNGDKTFYEIYQEIKDISIEAYENQEYPFERLVDKVRKGRDISRNPLFDTMFIMHNLDMPEMKIDNLNIIPLDFNSNMSKFDFSLFAYEKEEELYFVIEYCTDLFKKETIKQMGRNYITILEYLVSSTDMMIKNIELEKDFDTVGYDEMNVEFEF